MRFLDCRGLACPKPVLETKDAIEEHPEEGVQVRVDNEAGKVNVTRFLTSRGWQVDAAPDGEGGFVVTGTPSGEVSVACEIMTDVPEQEQKILVVIPTNLLGRGDEVLGRGLMKNFIATLRELEPDLWRIVLLNSGVRLAVQGSEHLDELRVLEKNGVDVLVCGTCLDHYGLLEKKAVGITTNMLDIVTSMQVASKVICV